jgi:hypothetical protein
LKVTRLAATEIGCLQTTVALSRSPTASGATIGKKSKIGHLTSGSMLPFRKFQQDE